MKSDDRVGVRPPGCTAAPALSRRHLIIGGSVALTAMATAPAPARAAETPDKLAVQQGDRIQVIKGDLKDQFLRPDSLEMATEPVSAYPFDPANDVLRRGSRLNRLLIIRLDPAELDDETRARSADGMMAFSAVCTHRGCTISHWEEEQRNFRCHCHLSAFSIPTGGSVANGPAQRQLAMVPLGVDDEGFVVAMGGFTGEVGGSKT